VGGVIIRCDSLSRKSIVFGFWQSIDHTKQLVLGKVGGVRSYGDHAVGKWGAWDMVVQFSFCVNNAFEYSGRAEFADCNE
jgi:hypothetical protein